MVSPTFPTVHVGLTFSSRCRSEPRTVAWRYTPSISQATSIRASGPGGLAPGLMSSGGIPNLGGMIAAVGTIGAATSTSSSGGSGGFSGGSSGGGGGGAGGGF